MQRAQTRAAEAETQARLAAERSRAEAEVLRYKLLAEHSRDVMLYVRREDGRILEANAAAIEAYGYTHEELQSLSIDELRDPAVRADMAAQLEEADRSGALFETVHRRKDGSTFPVEVSSQGASVDGVRMLVSVIRDISERRRVEEELRHHDERLRVALDASNAGTWEWDLRTNENFWSEELWKIYGLEPHSRTPSYEAWRQIIAPEDKEATERAVKEAAQAGADLDVEFRVQDLDGGERWIMARARPQRDSAGEPIRYVGIALDITQRKRVEEALRESEERYRALFENMLDGFAYCRMLYDEGGAPIDFVYLEVNDRFVEVTGLRDVVGKRVTTVIPGIRELNPELFDIYGRVAATGKPESFEINFKPLSRWLNVAAYGAGAGHFIAVFEDVSERKIHEIDRESMLAVLRVANAANNTRELIRTVTAELQKWSGFEAVGIRLQEGDDFPYCETRGFPAEFVEAEKRLCARDEDGNLLRDGSGSPVLECMCGNILCGRTDPRQAFFTAAGSFWTNSTTKLLGSTSEADRQARTRNRCHGEGYESVALVPLRCGPRTLGLMQFNDRRPDRFTSEKIAFMERVAGSLAMALEQHAAQAALGASERRFRLLVESSPDAIVVQTEGRIAYLNRAAVSLFGANSAEQLLGMPVLDRYPLELREIGQQRVRTANEERRAVPAAEMKFVRLDGSLVEVESSAVPVDFQGSSGALVFIRDVTERNRALAERERLREQLTQAQKMESIGSLAGGVAHDFNNLLTVINGYSSMLLKKAGPGDPTRGWLEEIRHAGHRAAELTQQLLAFSRKQILQPCVLDLNRVVEGMRPLVARLVGEDVELRIGLHPGPATINADPHQLEQVVMNLAVNARDAMPNGGTLAMTTSAVELDGAAAGAPANAPAGSYVLLAVSDGGTGMDEETRRRIFEPFFTTKGIGKGTGLGLSMTLGIVEQSGGYIAVDSAPGRGTTFRIYLPQAEGSVATDAPPDATPSGQGNETVLVVEDQPEVRTFVADALKTYGYRVIESADAEDALALCQRNRGRIDLVLTDVVMPNMGGRELAQRLRKDWADVNILFMSGYTDDAAMQQAGLESCVSFIRKPFSPDEIAARIREILAARDRPT
jgi:PAS domain S-box-containing protein